MKRAITVIALAAALFTIMGCGMKSKKERQEDRRNEPSFSLPLGSYQGYEGQLNRTDVSPESVALFASKSKELEQIRQAIAFGETMRFDGLPRGAELQHQANLAAWNQHRDLLKKEVSALESEIVAYRIRSMSFSVSKDGLGGVVLSNFSIETDKDLPAVKKDHKIGVLTKEGKVATEDISLFTGGRVFDFGTHPSLQNSSLVNNGAVLFDGHTGKTSFSFLHGSYAYLFEGMLGIEQYQGRSVNILQGTIRVIQTGETEAVQTGTWKVMYKSAADIAREKKEAEEKKPAVPTEEVRAAAPMPEEATLVGPAERKEITTPRGKARLY